MSFWRTFGFHTISPIDTLLEKPDCSLQELYDEDELLQECKSQNRRLLDFLTEPIHLEQMVQYLVEEAPEGSDEKRALKYPYLSSEVLSSDLWQIVEAVYNHPTVLQMIYSFLNRDPPVNPLLANYSTKVAAALMQRKVPETLELLKTKLPNIVSRLVLHLNSPGVMELLMKIVTADEGTGVDVYGTVKWLCEQNLVGLLADRFVESNDPEVHENVAQALVDLVTVTSSSPAAQTAGTVSPIILQLESRPVVTKLLDRIFQTGENGSALQSGLGILIELLNRCRLPGYDPAVTEMSELLSMVTDRFADCQKILDGVVPREGLAAPASAAAAATSSGEEMVLTFGTLYPPLGLARQRVLDFVKAIICSNSRAVFDAFLTNPLLETCVNLFFHFQWNTFLHQTVFEIIVTVLTSSHSPLKTHLLVNCHLIDLILQAEALNKQELAKTNMALGYIGHLTKISGLLNTLAHPTDPEHTPDPELAVLLDAKPEWQEYSASALEVRAKKESQLLGGVRPVAQAALGDELDQNGAMDPQAGGLAGIMYRIGAIGTAFDQTDGDEPPEDGEMGENIFDPNEFDARAPFATEEKPFGFDNFEDNSSGSSSDDDEDDDDDEAHHSKGRESGETQESDDGEVLIHTGIGGTHVENYEDEEEEEEDEEVITHASPATEPNAESTSGDHAAIGEEESSRVVSTPPQDIPTSSTAPTTTKQTADEEIKHVDTPAPTSPTPSHVVEAAATEAATVPATTEEFPAPPTPTPATEAK